MQNVNINLFSTPGNENRYGLLVVGYVVAGNILCCPLYNLNRKS